MITKIRVKSSHIEFQLDGGGYGTMGDETSSSVYVEPTPKSNREKILEADIKRERNPERRSELKEELEDLQASGSGRTSGAGPTPRRRRTGRSRTSGSVAGRAVRGSMSAFAMRSPRAR